MKVKGAFGLPFFWCAGILTSVSSLKPKYSELRLPESGSSRREKKVFNRRVKFIRPVDIQIEYEDEHDDEDEKPAHGLWRNLLYSILNQNKKQAS